MAQEEEEEGLRRIGDARESSAKMRSDKERKGGRGRGRDAGGCANRRRRKSAAATNLVGSSKASSENVIYAPKKGRESSRSPAIATMLTGSCMSTAAAEAGGSGHSLAVGPAMPPSAAVVAAVVTAALVALGEVVASLRSNECAALLRGGRATAGDLLPSVRRCAYAFDRGGCGGGAGHWDDMTSA